MQVPRIKSEGPWLEIASSKETQMRRAVFIPDYFPKITDIIYPPFKVISLCFVFTWKTKKETLVKHSFPVSKLVLLVRCGI